MKLNKKISRLALNKWGVKAQILKLGEEANELSREVLRKFNGYANEDEFIEELVDVQIMCAQLEYFLKIEDITHLKYDQMFFSKIERLKERLEIDKF